MAIMNRITISLICLAVISTVLPASAIMYASGATDDNSDDLSGTGESTDNSGSSTGGSTDNGAASHTKSMAM